MSPVREFLTGFFIGIYVKKKDTEIFKVSFSVKRIIYSKVSPVRAFPFSVITLII